MKTLRLWVRAVISSYAEIFFLEGFPTGLALLLATMTNPIMGCAGLAAVTAAAMIARLLAMQEIFLTYGFYRYNAVLVGLFLGWLLEPGPAILPWGTLFWAALGGMLSLPVSAALGAFLYRFLNLPVLSLPFALTGMLLFSIFNLFQGSGAGLALPGVGESFVTAYFQALGMVLLVPTPLAGALIFLALLLRSRLLVIASLIGFCFALAVEHFTGNTLIFVSLIASRFNYMMTAMALSAVFLLPSPRNLPMTILGLGLTGLFILVGTRTAIQFGILFPALPFNLATMLMLYVLAVNESPLLLRRRCATPEQSLDYHLSQAGRCSAQDRSLHLPFRGTWTVWQACNGAWTHRGIYCYAYDFIIEYKGSSFQGEGNRLEEYYCFNQPVLSPCTGRIVEVVRDIADNPPGMVNCDKNWGNLVIIETAAGYFVELSHFAYDSILVRVGERVDTGTLLGRCGNSGFSPQPHIHMQVQAGPQIGSVTLPFSLAGYLLDGCFQDHGLPEKGALVEALEPDPRLSTRFSFPLGARFSLCVEQEGRPVDQAELEVRLDRQGESCLMSKSSKQGKQGRLYFARDRYSFYFHRLEGNDPWLALLYSALPRILFIHRPELTWNDTPPLLTIRNDLAAQALLLGQAVHADFRRPRYHACWKRGGVLQARIENGNPASTRHIRATIHSQFGFYRINCGEYTLKMEPIRTKR